MKFIPVLLVGASLAAIACATDEPSASVVWRIGSFDGSSGEFSPKRERREVVFTPGQSDPATGWMSAQAVGQPGHSPQTVEFQLASAPPPDAAYRVRVAAIFQNAGIPALNVSINGRRGSFRFHPRIDNRMGDAVGGNRTAYSSAELQFEFPGSYLSAGRNRISFQPVAVSAKHVPDAGLNYDALELSLVPGPFDPGRITATIAPTIYYVEKEGKLHELIHVDVRHRSRLAGASVELELGGASHRKPLSGDQDFGEQRAVFAVPEFSGPARARATVQASGTTRRFDSSVVPGKKWTVLVVPHVHLDVGYTDVQAKVGTLQARALEQAMQLAERHPGFRFTTDGSWCVEQFMKTRGPEDRQKLIRAIKDGRIFVPANYCSLLTGFPTAETLIRSLYYSANLSRQYGTPFDFATMTDAPSYTWSYASVLAAARLRYFLGGSNSDRGPILLIGNLRERSPMEWQGPDGQGVLFWYARVYRQVQMLFGLPPIVEAGEEMLPVFLQTYESPLYRSDAVILYGTQGENRELFPEQAELVGRWNERFAFPKLQYSGVKDAIMEVARRAGGDTEVVRGDGGPYWEDDIAANPVHAAIERRNERRAPSAEKIATIATLVNPRLAADRRAIADMWNEMVLYDEHNCLMPEAAHEHATMNSVEQISVKNSHAKRAEQLSKHVLQGSMAAVADVIDAGRGSLVVFNSLNWSRSGDVVFDLRDGDELVDAVTRKAVPCEPLTRGRTFRRVRFIARDVPAMGYKVYLTRSAPAGALAVADEATKTLEDMLADERGGTSEGHPDERGPAPQDAPLPATLESRHYRIELDAASGAVRSIFDKELRRELVDAASPHRFGQYLYVTGGDMPIGKLNGLLQYAKPKPELTINHSEKGRLLSVTRTAYGWSARLESSAVNTPLIATEIRLFEGEKRIEFIHDVTKRQVYRREGVYFAFPFAMKNPQFQYEIQNGVVDPAKDMLPGAGLEWFSVQHWASVQEAGFSASVLPLDAPLMTFGDIIRGEWPRQFGARPGVLFSHVVNNYHAPRALVDWSAEPKHDKLRFRYVVTSAPSTDRVALSRLGWEKITPLETNLIQNQDRSTWVRSRPLDGTQGRFLEVEDPNLLLSVWKPAEDGEGTILRFIDLGGVQRKVGVTVPLLKLNGVRLTDAVERNLTELPRTGAHRFEFDIRPHQIVTIRLTGTSMLR